MRTLGVLLMAAWLGGCAAMVSGYGQGGRDASGRSYEEARADNMISAAVTSALVSDPGVAAMEIEVDTFNGVVTLSGRVSSADAARQAGRLAAAVDGVKRVENSLRVAR